MNIPDVLRWGKSEPKKKSDPSLAQTSPYMTPLIWCFKVYDEHFASRLQRAPDELARIVKREPLLATLPKLRKRTLTYPLPPIESIQKLSSSIRRSRQITHSQQTCLFLTKLPYELRLLIYGEVLAGGSRNVVHLLRKYDRLGHWRCRLQDGEELCDTKGERCVEGWLKYKRNVWHMDKIGRIDLITDGGLVGLLCSCRVVYSEGINVLYSKNIFHFYDPGDIRYFSQAVLPSRLDSIQSIYIDWERTFSIFNPYNTLPKHDEEEWIAWSEAWSIIANMRGLREVRVFLKKHKFGVSKSRRLKMLEPLMMVTGLQVFEVTIPWISDMYREFGIDAPFKIIEKPVDAAVTEINRDQLDDSFQ